MMTLVAFIIAIGVLVTIHEFGHYWAARACGVRVLRFSIGFGKPIFRYQRTAEATEWLVCLLPLGGYVKMLDSREKADTVEVPSLAVPAVDWAQAFDRKSVWAKMWIVFAGPLANLLLAFVCYWGLLAHGEIGVKPYIGQIEPHSLAAQAKLRKGDMLIALNGQPVVTWQDAQWQLLESWIAHEPVIVVTRTVQGDVHKHLLKMADLPGEAGGDVLAAVGVSMLMPVIPAVIGEVIPASVAEKSGLQKGDLILAVNRKPVQDWQQFVKWVRANPAKPLQIQYQRDGQDFQIKVLPESITEGGQRVGRLGAGVNMAAVDLAPYKVERHYSLAEAAGRALHKVKDTIEFTLTMLGKMLVGQASLKAISGPVSIADAAGETASLGIKRYIGFIALLSISIGVMNLLPIPVLDGGHLLYHMAELIRGKPLPDRVLEIGQRLGLGILGALMLIAFLNDINRYLVG